MGFPYKTVLVVGATSGIGLALAERLLENGSKVIAVGRRQENLDSFVQKHGKSNASSIKFDITDLKSIPDFVKRTTETHPGLDCIILNSGIQRTVDFSKPEGIDLDMVENEMTTNYTSYVHLVAGFLPYLQKQPMSTSLVFVSSGLALVPSSRCANYSASKAALHHLIISMREQLKGSNVKIIEILPPAVQTELHDAKHQPDLQNGNGKPVGIPLEDFTNAAWKGLDDGKEQIPVGSATADYEKFEWKRQDSFHALVDKMKSRK